MWYVNILLLVTGVLLLSYHLRECWFEQARQPVCQHWCWWHKPPHNNHCHPSCKQMWAPWTGYHQLLDCSCLPSHTLCLNLIYCKLYTFIFKYGRMSVIRLDISFVQKTDLHTNFYGVYDTDNQYDKFDIVKCFPCRVTYF